MPEETQPMRRITLVLAALLLVAPGSVAGAQEFPTRPIRIVVPFPPAGNVDITARALAPVLSQQLGQQVVVENRPGAGGTMGAAQVAKAQPDGYTLLLGSSGVVTIAPTIYRSIEYDPLKDLTTLGPIHAVPMVLTAAPKTPVTNLKELAELSKSKNGQVSVGSAGNGTTNHLAIEMLVRQSGIQLLHVPYKGSGPALNDVVASQIGMMMDQLTASIGHIKEGRLKPVGLTSATRSPQLPDVPTFAELGLAGYEATTFTGLFAPARLPPQVDKKLSEALAAAMRDEGLRQRYLGMGVEIIGMNRAEFIEYVRRDYEKWLKLTREANIVVE